MKIEAYLVFCVMVHFATPQLTSSRRLSKTPCEIRGTALVEQFFNVIFAEFQHSPPICICVQMCADQPTYCYPNGCFKRAEIKKESSPFSSIQQDTNTLFLFDNHSEVPNLIGNVNLMASSGIGTKEESYQRPWEPYTMSSCNPFKEIIFKYKRLPKLQMKYNLREQIKHAREKKAEVDLSKTRWPTNKQINGQINRQRTSNYLTPVIPETNQQETQKYLKRYLTKRENQIGLDISALYLYKDVSNFSLETLIDNLIERGLEGVNSTSFKASNSDKVKDEENNSDTKLMNSVVEDLQNNTGKISVDTSTKDNNNKIRYKFNSNHTNSSTAAYFDIITTLSKEIEKQNNLSLKVIGNLTCNTFNISDAKSSNFSNSREAIDRFKTALKVSQEMKSTTCKAPTNLSFIPVINSQVKKNKQRIVRKLRNRKLN